MEIFESVYDLKKSFLTQLKIKMVVTMYSDKSFNNAKQGKKQNRRMTTQKISGGPRANSSHSW